MMKEMAALKGGALHPTSNNSGTSTYRSESLRNSTPQIKENERHLRRGRNKAKCRPCGAELGNSETAATNASRLAEVTIKQTVSGNKQPPSRQTRPELSAPSTPLPLVRLPIGNTQM